MRNEWMKWWMMGVAITSAVACGDSNDTRNDTPDGVVKSVVGDSKSDAWNWRNNPVQFRAELNYAFDELPLEGASSRTAWPATYWPYYEDGINARWQGNSILSPAEKYDKVFHAWTPDENFMGLKPFNPSTCEWDDAYYSQLGPVATWTHENKGNVTSSNGIDDDEDGIADADECGWGDENKDRDGVEGWWGICHAWAPAAIMEDEPVEAVTRDGVTFEVSDIKALLIQQYDRTSAYMLGGRCNEEEIERDENGRIVNDECRDLNAGTFHVILANFLGVNQRPLVIERTTNYQVWNQPLVGFKVTENREVTLDEAHELLGVDAEGDVGTGEFVHGIEQGTADATGVLELVNAATFEELDVDARLDRRAAQNIVDGRPFATLAELDDVSYVGASAFGRLLDFAKASGYWVAPVVEYAYNASAVRFIEVRATTDWVTESSPSTEPMAPQVDNYTHHDSYHYILELDASGNIVGGEWIGQSHGTHPDFIWLPVRAYAGNPHIDTDIVRELLAESRQNVDVDVPDALVFTSTDAVEIPDNDPTGALSLLTIEETGQIRDLTIDLQIEHTYRGDLIVELRHAGVSMNVFDGTTVANGWDDDVVLTGEIIDGFMGAELSGDWELVVVDRMGADTGSVVTWSLNVVTE